MFLLASIEGQEPVRSTTPPGVAVTVTPRRWQVMTLLCTLGTGLASYLDRTLGSGDGSFLLRHHRAIASEEDNSVEVPCRFLASDNDPVRKECCTGNGLNHERPVYPGTLAKRASGLLLVVYLFYVAIVTTINLFTFDVLTSSTTRDTWIPTAALFIPERSRMNVQLWVSHAEGAK